MRKKFKKKKTYYTGCQFIKHMKYDKAEKVCEEEAQEDDVQGPNHQLICNY